MFLVMRNVECLLIGQFYSLYLSIFLEIGFCSIMVEYGVFVYLYCIGRVVYCSLILFDCLFRYYSVFLINMS